MNWIERQGVLFSGEYRLCRTTRGEWDVWSFAQTKNGVLKRGFATAADAKKFADAHESRERSLLQALDAVHVK